MPSRAAQPPLPVQTLSADLVLGPRTAAFSRRLLRLVLEQWGVRDEPAVDAAVLVVSELVTNAERHCGSGEGSLEVPLQAGGVRIAVVDCSPVVPQQRAAHADDESGRGLQLVGHLSSSWGVEPFRDGKRVFAVVAVPTAVCA